MSAACPFCGSYELKVALRHEPDLNQCHAVMCRDCGAMGPPIKHGPHSEKVAELAWEARN